jgi:hypothetical protein
MLHLVSDGRFAFLVSKSDPLERDEAEWHTRMWHERCSDQPGSNLLDLGYMPRYMTILG